MQDHALYCCAENPLSPRKKTGEEVAVIKSGSVVEAIKSYFGMSEPYNVHAGRPTFAMKKSVNSGSNKIHVPFGPGSVCL